MGCLTCLVKNGEIRPSRAIKQFKNNERKEINSILERNNS